MAPKYEGIEWPVMITCGYSSSWLSKKDYVTRVGGTASGYKACGFIGNSGETYINYRGWNDLLSAEIEDKSSGWYVFGRKG